MGGGHVVRPRRRAEVRAVRRSAARKLRDENVFKFIPMLNPDSVAAGEVRFNLNGFDPNRQWPEVDLRDKQWLERAPEIWYAKRAILDQHARRPIDIALNLHATPR